MRWRGAYAVFVKDIRAIAAKMQKENNAPVESHQYVGPYRLEKTLGKGQTGKYS